MGEQLYLIKILQKNPTLFKDEILKCTDEQINLFLTELFFMNKDIFDLLITYFGQNDNDYFVIQLFLRVLRNNNMEIYKYILFYNIPYIFNYYLLNDFKNLKYIFDNLLVYDSLLINIINYLSFSGNLLLLNEKLEMEELKIYRNIINTKLREFKINFILEDLNENRIENNDNKELFYYENVKKNKILKMSEIKNLFEKENTIFVNGNHLIVMNENMCENKYKNIFIVDNLINNTEFDNKKLIDLFNLVILMKSDDYKVMFPLYIDNKINMIKYNNIYFLGIDGDNFENIMEEIEKSYCSNNDIVLTNINNSGIKNKNNTNINIVKLENINQLLKYFRDYKNKF